MGHLTKQIIKHAKPGSSPVVPSQNARTMRNAKTPACAGVFGSLDVVELIGASIRKGLRGSSTPCRSHRIR